MVEVVDGDDIHPVLERLADEAPADQDPVLRGVAQKHLGDAARLSFVLRVVGGVFVCYGWGGQGVNVLVCLCACVQTK